LVLGTTWIWKSGAILQSDGRRIGVTLGGKEETKGCRTDMCPKPFVSVDVDGIGRLKALVDTGYSKSSIGRVLLTDMQMSKGIPTSNIRVLANGTQIKELGFVSLNITFQGITTCIENVAVASRLNYELILGMDWIDQTRVVIQSDGLEIIVSQPDSRP